MSMTTHDPQPARATEPYPGERRRARWQDFRHAYPGILATMSFALISFLAVDGWLVYKRVKYAREIERLRSGMTSVERRKTDMALASDQNRFKVMVELLKRQAQGDKELHLSIAVDSGTMHLEREGAKLRDMAVQVGKERWVGTAPDTVKMAAPRGTRTIEKILGPNASFEMPSWVYTDRGLPVPSERTLKGALGPAALVLNGGTVIYSMPSVGPLNDSSYVMPGSLRARAVDLRAVLPNLKPGFTVYFY
jgi:hypothetical protein